MFWNKFHHNYDHPGVTTRRCQDFECPKPERPKYNDCLHWGLQRCALKKHTTVVYWNSFTPPFTLIPQVNLLAHKSISYPTNKQTQTQNSRQLMWTQTQNSWQLMWTQTQNSRQLMWTQTQMETHFSCSRLSSSAFLASLACCSAGSWAITACTEHIRFHRKN